MDSTEKTVAATRVSPVADHPSGAVPGHRHYHELRTGAPGADSTPWPNLWLGSPERAAVVAARAQVAVARRVCAFFDLDESLQVVDTILSTVDANLAAAAGAGTVETSGVRDHLATAIEAAAQLRARQVPSSSQDGELLQILQASLRRAHRAVGVDAEQLETVAS